MYKLSDFILSFNFIATNVSSIDQSLNIDMVRFGRAGEVTGVISFTVSWKVSTG